MVRCSPELLVGVLLLAGIVDAAHAGQPQIRTIRSGPVVETRRPGELMHVPQRTALIRSVNSSSDKVMAANQPLRIPPPPQPTAAQIQAAQQQTLEENLAASFRKMGGSQPRAIAVASPPSTSAIGARVLTSAAAQPVVPGYRQHNYVPKHAKRLYSLNTYQSQIQYASRAHGVDEALVRAIIHAESSYNPKARSHVGAGGLMQLMPATAARFGVTNRYDPSQNIDGGTRYLAWLLRRYRGNVTLASAAYNAGEGAVDKYKGVPPYRETINYVQKVGGLLSQYRRAIHGVFDGRMVSNQLSGSGQGYASAYTSGLRVITSK